MSRNKKGRLITDGSHYAIGHYFRNKEVILKEKRMINDGFASFFSSEYEIKVLEDVIRERDFDGVFIVDGSFPNPFLQYGMNYFAGEITELENDRIATLKAFERARIRQPAFDVAETFDELMRKVEDFPYEKIVVKGDKEIPSWGTLSGHKEKIIEVLRRNERLWGEEKYWVIQEFKEGWEISCEIYVIDGVVRGALTNFTCETKFFGGLRTGGETNLVFPKFENEFLHRLEEETMKLMDVIKVRNTLYDINYIVDGAGRTYALEITPRIGYPGTITFAHILYNNGFYYDEVIANKGEIEKELVGLGFTIKLSLPPYPFLSYKDVRDLEKFFEDEVEKGDESKKRKLKEYLKTLKNLPNFKGVVIPLDKVEEVILKNEKREGEIMIVWDGIDLGGRIEEEGGNEEKERKREEGTVLDAELGLLNVYSLDPAIAINTAYKIASELKEYIPALQYAPPTEWLSYIIFQVINMEKVV